MNHKDLMDNDKNWMIKVTKGTKAVPEGLYTLYTFNNKEMMWISYKTALDRLQKGKAEIVIK